MVLNELNECIIDCARTEKWKVCIYGLGYLGRKISGRVIDILHLQIDFYCDGNKKSVDSFHFPDAIGIYKERLMEIKESVLVLILVDYPNDIEICSELAGNPCLHTVRLWDIAAMEEVMADFYGDELYKLYRKLEQSPDKHCEVVNKKLVNGLTRTAIYTCITGGYDKLRQPDVVEESCDYYVISDDPEMGGGIYQHLDINAFVPDSSMSAKDKNRYCKMHPHDIFPEYDYTIYLDGSIKVKRPIAHYTQQIGGSGLAIHKHKIQNCVYIDGIFAEWLGVVDKNEIIEELKRYINDGLPKKYGLFECGMIVTDLKNRMGQQLCRQWFEEYQKGAKRDQFSLIYVLWKMGLTANAIGILSPGNNIVTNQDIIWDSKGHYI